MKTATAVNIHYSLISDVVVCTLTVFDFGRVEHNTYMGYGEHEFDALQSAVWSSMYAEDENPVWIDPNEPVEGGAA